MKPLVISHRILTWLCMCPADESTRRSTKIFYAIFGLTIFSINLCNISAGTAFVLKFISTDLESALYGVFNAIAPASMMYVMIATLFLRYEVKGIFDKLSRIYDASKHFLCKKIYARNSKLFGQNRFV